MWYCWIWSRISISIDARTDYSQTTAPDSKRQRTSSEAPVSGSQSWPAPVPGFQASAPRSTGTGYSGPRAYESHQPWSSALPSHQVSGRSDPTNQSASVQSPQRSDESIDDDPQDYYDSETVSKSQSAQDNEGSRQSNTQTKRPRPWDL